MLLRQMPLVPVLQAERPVKRASINRQDLYLHHLRLVRLCHLFDRLPKIGLPMVSVLLEGCGGGVS